MEPYLHLDVYIFGVVQWNFAGNIHSLAEHGDERSPQVAPGLHVGDLTNEGAGSACVRPWTELYLNWGTVDSPTAMRIA